MRSTSLFAAPLVAGSVFARSAPGDSLFNIDQVVTLDLTFTDVLRVTLPTGYCAEDPRLMDALGRSMPVSHSGSTIDLSGLASGAYVILVDGPSGQASARVLKN